MSDQVKLRTISERCDKYFKSYDVDAEGYVIRKSTTVEPENYSSARVIINLAMAFNKDIDTNNPKYDKYYNDYKLVEKQLAATFNKLKQLYKGKTIAIDAITPDGKPAVITMEAERFFQYSMENLEYSVKQRGIKFDKSLFQPQPTRFASEGKEM